MTKLIVGLGNPGEKFKGTRHNLGFELVDEHRRKTNGEEWKFEKKFNSEFCILNSEVILLKPQTFMNLSGSAVARFVNFYKIDPEDILIIHDDLDLPLGKIKIRLGGSAAGHHGVESIIEKLGTDKFVRLRLGIGNPKTQASEHHQASLNIDSFVTSKFNEHEVSAVKHMLKQAEKAVEIYLSGGLEIAQRQFN